MAGVAETERMLEGLRAAQERIWGRERSEALDDSLRRMATALATVEQFALVAGDEPFPIGPEAPRG